MPHMFAAEVLEFPMLSRPAVFAGGPLRNWRRSFQLGRDPAWTRGASRIAVRVRFENR